MEVQDRSRSPSRRTSRVEQVVGRWLRRSRDLGSRSHSLSRERIAVDGKSAESSGSDQRNYPFRFTVQIQRDPNLNSHGLTLSTQTPILVQDVTPGGPADGRLVPGDQLVKINNIAVDDLTPEQAAEIIRECQDTLTMTVLRTMLGPKSSFITPEKRAKLRSNPVKVHFAEEVEVNGHSQGNSLLFLPNVLKVYLENGQTKAFKFDSSTTVKDIVMTLKEKLSLSRIEHFSLVLEKQHSISVLLLLHEEERIQQVVQKREAHAYRCLFRVCFMPKPLQTLLQQDPNAFEYLYLQGVNDVLQERFAIEMRCNTALRLAALHIQERLVSCGQSPKTNLKMITKTWGIENFVSSTLLRNMREKDLRKAITYHMKKSQSQNDPKQKGLSVDQTRLNYLEELSELKSFGGKSFSATMMLQDRESMVTLLVGARYGVSQVVNHKLGILSPLTEFTSITRIELLPESDKVSLVKIYLQDIKPITLLLESASAKDMSCLIAGYCRVFVDPSLNVFPWIHDSKKHRVSAEEGYVSRCGSDSDTSSDLEALVTQVSHDERPCPRVRSSSDPDGRKKKDRHRRRSKDGREKGDKPWEDNKQKEEKDADNAKEKSPLDKNRENKNKDPEHEEETERAHDGQQTQTQVTDNNPGEQRENLGQEGGEELRVAEEQPSVSLSEASDSWNTDSRVVNSPSSDSLDALEEDDLISCSSSSFHPKAPSHTHAHGHPPHHFHPHYSPRHVHSQFLAPPPAHTHPLIHLTTHDSGGSGCRRSGDGADPQIFVPVPSSPSLRHVQKGSGNPCSDDSSLCFAELSRLVDFLPSPPEASEDDEEEEMRRRRWRRRKMLKETGESLSRAVERGSSSRCSQSLGEHLLSPSPSSSSHLEFVFNFDQSDARCYYKLCSNITPDSARSLPHSLHGNEEEDGEKVEEDSGKAVDLESIPILQPPPGFGDSSSDEEFFDARDRFTSPEDPSSGAMPRDIRTDMKLDFLSTLSLSDIRVSVTDTDRDGIVEGDRKEGGEEGGGRETLFQLRKRSRKRRSFVETDYTSRVSYPEPDPDMQDLVLSRRHKNLLAEANDAQILSSDPEPSEQTQNPSPTVSSLTHSEGEPAQLESKPILSKPSLHGPGSLHGLGSQEQTRDPPAPSRTRKQEMEMEPDAMESKSVTDVVKAASPTITVVRCRVDPDGKESADRRGDGKEEGGEQREISEAKEEGEEETASVSGNGPFTNHMFLPESSAEKGKGGKEKKEVVSEYSPSSSRPLIGAERQPEANTPPTCLIDVTKKSSNGLLGVHLIALEQNSYVEELKLEGVCEMSNPPSNSPPPPPPSSPLPPITVLHKSQSDCFLREEGCSENTGTSTKMSHSEERPTGKQSHTKKAQLHLDITTSINEDAIRVSSSARTTSDEVTDSSNSDNVFDDDEVTNSLNSISNDKNDNCAIAPKHSISANSAIPSKGESQVTVKSLTDTEAHTRIHLVNSDYTRAINSITAKLGAATKATSPTFDSGTRLQSKVTRDSAPCLKQNVNKPQSDEAKAKTPTVHNLCKAPPSPTHFLFQTCSPSFMGSLSASTLRGKIQNLPLYLTRSQETLNQVVAGNVPQSPAEDKSRDDREIIIKVTDVDNVTQTIDFEMDPTAESVESDDSDTTVIGSERDGEFFVEKNLAKSFHSVLEVKEASAPLPVQTEPKPQHQNLLLYTGPVKNTPGPITEPPASIVNSLERDTSGLKMDTPGPVKDAPESKMMVRSPGEDIPGYKMNSQSRSIPPPIVVTTQNLNGPGLPFHSQSQKVNRTSSDRPLMGLCSPTGQTSDSSKTLSSDCRVFTICEDPSKTKGPAEVGTTPPLKSEFGCTSVLASGCESVVEGVQVPLDACGCPPVYTNCFSSGDSFDEELTVYEFSCRTQSSGVTPTSGADLPLVTSPPSPSFLSTNSPSFPRSILFSSSTSELSPLLSPLSDASDRFLSQTHKDTISRLGQQHFPEPPTGFQVLRVDVDQLLSILESSGADRSLTGHGGRHPSDTCPAHFTENKRVLQIEARRLMSGCQKVVGIEQSPEAMLHSLADSFRTLVELAGICLWFSGCERCDRRNAEAVAGLADVARSFRDFCLAAERANSKRSCQDLSTKLLAKQCTALTASVFCLTQLFRTLTAL
ncbi:FERM and PDZ domain-containing protein 1 [Etheostoma cragini]|uniref:FERM and PDZ domain-containing protein 1 n=1 Tax=Etheostoma cragini TaxID=417921 RepID=UPI00155F2F1B|nr:FERM and PDZ domain-containing protein 1 [Etheostoma cragini]XP_034744606.1 FERM and PDZ domain-containing protein 1 [Etheostoma cragini]